MPSSVHISLNVSDLDRSVEFYRRFFGEPVKQKSGYVKFVGTDPEIHLALQPGSVANAASGALSHFGIRVDSTEEVKRRRDEMTLRGLAAGAESREACCYALQDKFWLTDPDGNRWEVYTVLEDLEKEKQSATACCQPATEADASCCAP